MKSYSSFSAFHSTEKPAEGSSSMIKGFDFMIPEGRVHGGGFMSLLGRNLSSAVGEV